MTDRFERIYAQAGDDLASVPWAGLRPSTGFVAWLETFSALPDQRRESYPAIAATVAEGGTLFVRCLADQGQAVDGPPWPVTSDELQGIADAGVTVDSVEDVTQSRWWEVVATRA